MSMYTFLPSPDAAGREEYYASWDNAFSQSEITNLINYGDALAKYPAFVGSDNVEDKTVRRAKIAWIESNPQTVWLYDKLAYVARQINGQNFGFDLTGFGEDFQYTVYNGNDASFYDWHMDKSYAQGGAAPRKLSMVVQLSDPTEYEGGDLALRIGGKEDVTLDKAQGKIHCFPSWILHTVTPVTAGTRKSLVVWTCGPRFR